MNSTRGMNRHFSAKLCNERTTADSLEANRFFEYEAQVPRIKLSDDFDLPTIKRCDDMWSDCDESCRNFEFATGTSFFSQNYNIDIMKNSLPQSNDISLAYTNKTQFIIGICVLIVMIISCSLIGPLTLALPSKSLLIQIIWRYFGSTIISVPLMFGLYAIKGSDMNFKNDFSKNQFKRCLINSLLIFLWNFGFILGCSMTIISQANLCNSSGVFTLIIAILCRRQIHKLEFAGYGLFIVGVIFMLLDPFANKVDASSQSNFGVVFSLIGAISCAIYNFINENAENDTHPFVIITQNYIMATVLQLAIFPLIIGYGLFFSFDSEYGVFEMFCSFNVFLQVIGTALITGVVCYLSLYLSYFYFPIHIVAVVMLFEPVIAQVFSILLGQDLIPGLFTAIGCFLAVLGFGVSGYGFRQKFQSNKKVYF